MKTNRIHITSTLRSVALGLTLLALLGGCQKPTFKEPIKEPDAVTLVRDGTAAATIVISAKRSKVNELAVKELNDHLEKITGARLPVVTDDQAVTGPRVLVGESEATKALGLKSDDFKDQEYLVRSTPDTLVLMGKDDFEAPVKGRSANDVWVAGKWGKALAFNGQDTLFTATKHGFNDAEGTLECWVKLDASSDGGAILRLTNHLVDKNNRDHVILLREGNRIRYRSIADGRENFLLSGELTPGWHHVLATHSASAKKIELIVDGVSQGTAPYIPTSLAKAPLSIGGVRIANRPEVWTPLMGIVDDIRISRIVRPGTVPDQPLVADADTTLLLSCDEGEGTPAGTVRDTRSEGLEQLPKKFSRVGTLHAIYDFLENDCGVRWYAPGELGVVADKASHVGRPAGERRREPAMSYREIRWGKPGYEEKLWSLRMRIDERFLKGNHSFVGYYNRFSKRYGRNPAKLEADRPEFFAKGLTEAQMQAPEAAGGIPNLCYSSPELVAQVVQDARDFFDGKSSIPDLLARGDYYALGPMDMSPYCKCADCQAALRAPADAIDRGMASTYWFAFVNRVAKELRKTHPDKILTVLAYSEFANPPEGFVLEPNVAVTFCALGPSMWWDPARRERDRRAFDEGWAKQGRDSIPLYGWLYYLGGMMGQTESDYPEACAFRIPAFMQQLHAAEMRGLFINQAEQFGYSFLLSQLELYLTLKLADNPTLDGNVLIDEFFTRYYGEAGPMMKQLYAEMEAVKFDLSNYPEAVQRGDKYNLLSREVAYRHLVTPERAERWGKLMDTALATATGAYKERVQRYKTEVWDRMMTARSTYLSTKQPK